MRARFFLLLFIALPLTAQGTEDVQQSEIDSLRSQLKETQARLDSLVRTNNPIDLGNKITEAYKKGTENATTILIVISVALGIVATLGTILGLMGVGQSFRAGRIVAEAKETNIEVKNAKEDITRMKFEIGNMFKEVTSCVKTVNTCEEEIKAHLEKAKVGSAEIEKLMNQSSTLTSTKETHMGLGTLFKNNGMYTEAIREFEEAIKQAPQDAEAWFQKGFCLVVVGSYQDALVAYNEVIKINPDADGAYYNMAIAYVNLREFDKALDCLDKSKKACESKQEIFGYSTRAWENISFVPLLESPYRKRFIEIVGPKPPEEEGKPKGKGKK